MRSTESSRRWTLVVLLAAALSLALTAGASAATPKKGKLYTGRTTASYNYFSAPVSFTVSGTGKQLLRFKWTGGGCLGLGGPGNAWANPEMNYKVGTIKVSRTGTFSVKKVRSTFKGSSGGTALTKVTTSTVKGHFKSAKTATGTISFTQKLTGRHACSGKVNFTATLGRAPGSLHKSSPGNGTTATSTTPALRWTASRYATTYRYCLDKSDNDTCNSSWVSTHKSTRATLKRLTAGATY